MNQEQREADEKEMKSLILQVHALAAKNDIPFIAIYDFNPPGDRFGDLNPSYHSPEGRGINRGDVLSVFAGLNGFSPEDIFVMTLTGEISP